METMKMKTPILLVSFLLVFMNSCNDSEDDNLDEMPMESELNPEFFKDFWYGYYFENPLTNPEDPTPGFVYLQIPESGAFEGEMYFSFVGCDDTFDVGQVSGTVSANSLDGSWQGMVDGAAVGGNYTGELNAQGDEYNGTYTNANGKVEIVCNEDDSIFVAPDGTWFLGESDQNNELNIQVETTSTPLNASWNDINGAFIYLYVLVDAECLSNGGDLESCLMWSGNTLTPSFTYGQGSEVPAKPLVSGGNYLLSISAVSATGTIVTSNNIAFVF